MFSGYDELEICWSQRSAGRLGPPGRQDGRGDLKVQQHAGVRGELVRKILRFFWMPD